MSTLRINNIEAKSVPASPTIDEKIKLTNSSGDVLVHVDGKTSGITTIGINTTAGNIKFDSNSNVVVTGIITATKFVGTIEPTNLTVSGDLTIPDKIIHSGDTNTAIRFPAADTISMETAGSTRFGLSSSGNIELHGTQTGNNVATIYNGTGALSFYASSNSGVNRDFRFYSSNSNSNESFRIDSSGRVMIGNTDAGSLYASGNNLVVGSGSGSEGITVYTGNSNQGILAFADGTSGGAQQYAGYMIYDHSTNHMLFATQATERLSIDSSGHLKHTGIRSGNSENKLAVLRAPSYNTSEEDVIIYQAENEVSSNQLTIGGGTGSLNAATTLRFLTASAVNTTGGTERFRIDSSGNLIMPAGAFDLSVGDNTNSNAGTQTISVGSISSGSSGGIGIFANPTNGNSFIQFGDGTASADQYRGYINYQHASDKLFFGTAGSNRVTITSDGKVSLGYPVTNPPAWLHVKGNTYQTLRLENFDGGANGPYIELYNNSNAPANNDYTGIISFKNRNTNNDEITYAQIRSQSTNVTDNQEDGILTFHTRSSGAFGERLRITSGGIIQCGTSGTLQALINNSVNGHQFISQCSDNNNGFEVYQKHGSSTTRNTFAVYANTGSGGAKSSQLLVRGDGLVTVDGDFDFNKFVPDGTITTTLSSSSSSGNYTTIIPLNTSGIGHLHVYLVSIHWSFNSNGGVPYYCSGAVLWQTPHSNANNGVNHPITMLSSCHVGGNYHLQIRNITGSSAYPGLQAANMNWTAQSGSHYIVKYKRIY